MLRLSALTVLVFLVVLELSLQGTALIAPCVLHYDNEDKFLCSLEQGLAHATHNQSTQKKQNLCDEWHPQLGWAPRPECVTPLYSVNALGYRGEIVEEKAIILLGDSFTWGERNGDEETYGHYMEAPTINLGVHGYGPTQMLLRYELEKNKYPHDQVILGLYVPDIHRTEQRVRDFFKPYYDKEEGKIVSEIPTISVAKEHSKAFNSKLRVWSYAYVSEVISLHREKKTHFSQDIEASIEVLRMLNASTNLTILLLPSKDMVGGGDYFGAYPLLLKELEGFVVIDATPALREAHQNGTRIFQGHYTKEANQLVAEVVDLST